MASKLKNLEVLEGSTCSKGANPLAKIVLFKRADAQAGNESPKGVTFLSATEVIENGIRKVIQAIGKRLNWGEGQVEEVVKEVAESTTFNEEFQQVMYRNVENEIWDTVYALERALISTLRDETVDREAKMRESIGQFSTAMQLAITSWVGGETIAKADTKPTKHIANVKEARKRLDAEIAQSEGGNPPAPAAVHKSAGEPKKEREVHPMPEINKSALPEDVRQYIEELEKKAGEANKMPEEITKQLDDLKKRADAAEAELKKERDERLTREYVAKAQGFANLSVNPQEFGAVLKALAEKCPDEYAKIEATLKAADEAVGKSALFDERGRPGVSAASAMGKIEAAAAELRKADPTLTQAQAVEKVLDQNPGLYDEYTRETVQGR